MLRKVGLHKSPRYERLGMAAPVRAHLRCKSPEAYSATSYFLGIDSLFGLLLFLRRWSDIESTALLVEYDASQRSLDLFGNNASDYDEEYTASIAESALDKATDAITVLVRRVRRHVLCCIVVSPAWCDSFFRCCLVIGSAVVHIVVCI